MADEIIVGVDVGGTFTDLLVCGPDGVRVAKVPTTLANQAFGVLAALDEAEIDLQRVATIVHGTTTTTNAVLERKLSRTGLITTRGFRDVLELGRRTRPKAYGLIAHFEPIIARELRLEVAERMAADGEVLTPLDEAGVADAVRALLAAGCESLVIHFLHAYRNPAHELRAVEIARSLWPNDYITAGSVVLSEYREYERGVTAAVNASVQPVLDRYLQRLGSELAARGYRRDLLVMRGNGGTVSARLVTESAVNTVMSGPASGVMAAAYTASRAGYPHVITYDMGGTSCDVGLIRDGVPAVSSELEVEYAMPIHVPMVDVHTIGAGGGSIARIDDAGMLQVGPHSAGATPGPICYGRGGELVTTTDANLYLGRLNPGALLAVDGAADIDAIGAALLGQIGAALGLDAEGAAAAIVRIANDRMAGALRMVSLSRGHDPRDFALFAFGGAGPLHAVDLARELGVPTVLVPARPGLTNALGCAVANLRHDYVRTVNAPLAELDMSLLRDVLATQAAEGQRLIEAEQVEVEGVDVLFSADMQFLGQSHMLAIPIASTDVSRETLQAAFEAAYFQRFDVELPEIRAVVVNLHTAVLGRRATLDLRALLPAADGPARAFGTRRVWFAEGWRDAPLWRREQLAAGAVLDGPAVIEQLDTTTVLPPGSRATVDDSGNLVIAVGRRMEP